MSFFEIKAESLVNKRLEILMATIGNAFAATTPFQNIPQIIDKTERKISFKSISIIPGNFFSSSGELRLQEEGARTRLFLSINLMGYYLLLYLIHWIPAIFLWVFQSLWVSLINPEMIGLVQGWILAALLAWPTLLFVIFKRIVKIRIQTYVHNIIFHT